MWITRSWRPGFKAPHKAEKDYYDLFYDYDLIEASFVQQYGIRLRHEKDMPYSEFATLLSGLGPETPLGAVVSIRAETRKEVLKDFTPHQRKIRQEWQSRSAKKMLMYDPEQAKAQINAIQEAFRMAYADK